MPPDQNHEFVPPHYDGAGEYYPGRAMVWDYSEVPHVGFIGGLGPDSRQADGFYRQEAFEIGTAIRAVGGPIVEMGGPTSGGYQVLDGVELPSRVIVTNLQGAHGPEGGILRAGGVTLDEDRLALDALADVRAMPLGSGSIGAVLAANIPMTDQFFGSSDALLAEEQKDPLTHWQMQIDEADRQYAQAMSYLADEDLEGLRRINDSPRIGAMLEAERILKPGGLYIAKGLDERDVVIAEAIGMKPVLHTPLINGLVLEMVFQKPGTGRAA